MTNDKPNSIDDIEELNDIEFDTSVTSDQCASFRKKRRNDEKSYSDIADEYDVNIEDVIIHVRGLCYCEDVSCEDLRDKATPWREKEVIEHLLLEKERFFTQMAEIMGCHPETAGNWVEKFDISPIPSSQRTSSKKVRRLHRIGALNSLSDDSEDSTRSLPTDGDMIN